MTRMQMMEAYADQLESCWGGETARAQTWREVQGWAKDVGKTGEYCEQHARDLAWRLIAGTFWSEHAKRLPLDSVMTVTMQFIHGVFVSESKRILREAAHAN